MVDGTEVSKLGAYSYFGEMSLLNDELTSADIIADRGMGCKAGERDASLTPQVGRLILLILLTSIGYNYHAHVTYVERVLLGRDVIWDMY
eukprot:1176516-Prorocentrum_minimum.AAC.1